MWTSGAGGPMTGRSADLLIIDDPHKNFDDAHSPTKRRSIWNWYLSVARSRVQPGGAIIVVQTRWHEEDLAGMLLASDEPWEHVRLPAIAEDDDILGRAPGEALWPDRYDVDYYAATEATVGPYIWAGLYQQRPAPLEGEMFKRPQWRFAIAAPTTRWLVRRWDLAATVSPTGDFTVGALLTIDDDGNTYVVDVTRVRASAADVERLIVATAEMDRARYGNRCLIRLEQEPGSSGKGVAENYVRGILAGYPAKAIPSTGDKTLRALPYSAQQQAGNIHLCRDTDGEIPAWWEMFIEEHALFPAGMHDDQVDAAAAAYMDLAELRRKRTKATVSSAADRHLTPTR
jgi:predicted phage terminase large subunit-like protein